MTDIRLRANLRTVTCAKPSALDNKTVVLEFTRVCRVVGIIDSETGLITDLPRSRPEPEK
ncbi:hypothetical protein HAP48_0049485 (plasmid) [Bradyrhizobium septentrionale]|uniref:Uncharacterized protein n=1 Tax=Bradyrhizobium septentrionale TaxID=1404411 RepID=A0A973WAB0_9BRAD|nr:MULTISPECIES: hypothetical protein [Bradyrhizobium]MCK7664935.1 hypothetical protein [Bradyrhizobium sp. 2S1]UGY20992.1 hypothetical protein HAP48_0049485 [Bradyrhizobium septentrionale]